MRTWSLWVCAHCLSPPVKWCSERPSSVPLGGFTPLQSEALSRVAHRLAATPMSVALALLLQRSPNILLIPGTSSTDHLRENIAGARLSLSDEEMAALDGLGH